MTHLLIVDDEKHFRTMLIRALKSQGHRATGIEDAYALASAVAIHRPDMVLLDLLYESGTSGLEMCRSLRSWSPIPVIIVSVSEDEATKIAALDAGADDYIVKPFGIEELLARIHAIQRRLARSSSNETTLLKVGDLVLDLDVGAVTVRGKEAHLTRNEHKLLRALVSAEGQAVSYSALLSHIYGRRADKQGERSSIRVLVKQLRRKLGEDLSNPVYVLTEAGVGYRFNMNPADIMRAVV
jgi:two-component system KDP operon response regulator KdpE